MNINFKPVKEFGEGVYQLTEGPFAHTHTYHKHCPWSPDGSKIMFFEYERTREEGRLLLMDVASGETRVIGTSDYWNAHQVADQMWLGTRNRILYRGTKINSNVEWRIIDLDGGEKTFHLPVQIGDGNDDFLVGGYSFDRVFPNDEMGDRSRCGLVGVDPETGAASLLCSAQQVLDAHPRKAEVEGLRMFTKQYLMHKRLPKVAFNFTNSVWTWMGQEQAKFSDVFAFDLETKEVTHVGPIAHHPIWHPAEPWVLSFSEDDQGRRRLAFDRLERGRFTREFLDYFSPSGHPSVDPTCRYIIIDSYARRKGHISLELFDLQDKEIHRLAECRQMTGAYPHTQIERCPGETMAAFTSRGNYGISKKYVVQAHPAWDRTGRYVAFNSDATGESQVYVIDLEELGLYRGQGRNT